MYSDVNVWKKTVNGEGLKRFLMAALSSATSIKLPFSASWERMIILRCICLQALAMEVTTFLWGAVSKNCHVKSHFAIYLCLLFGWNFPRPWATFQMFSVALAHMKWLMMFKGSQNWQEYRGWESILSLISWFRAHSLKYVPGRYSFYGLSCPMQLVLWMVIIWCRCKSCMKRCSHVTAKLPMCMMVSLSMIVDTHGWVLNHPAR